MKVIFKSPLRLEETCSGWWLHTSPFFATVYRDAAEHPEHPSWRIIVPEGQETDLCSVPRMPFAYLIFGGIANRAGALHDWVYSPRSGEIMTRKEADAMFAEALAVCGVSWGKRFLMHAAVRLFGGAYWKKEKQCPNPAPQP